MHRHHLAQHHEGRGEAAILALEIDDLGHLAFEMHRTLRHARHIDQRRGQLGETGEFELIHAIGQRRAALVHRLRQRPRRQVPDELAGLLAVAQRVLRRRAGEADDRRHVVECVEEAVRRQIDAAIPPLGRHPADRPRRDDGVERVMRQAMAQPRLVGMTIGHARRLSADARAGPRPSSPRPCHDAPPGPAALQTHPQC